MARLIPARGAVAARPGAAARVRLATAADRAALARLGHAPLVAMVLAPTPGMRFGWAIGGTRAAGLVAEENDAIIGSIHFVRSALDHATWMFGHWRVAPQHRRRGVGALLLREGVRRLRGIERLYSYVEHGNEASLAAHRRLGFESAPTLQGSVTLGALSTLGPPAPALRLEPVGAGKRAALLPLYAAAAGSLWMRLFPGLMRSDILLADLTGPEAFRPMPRVVLAGGARVFVVRHPGGAPAGYVVRDGSSCTLSFDPAGCDASVLARTAAQLLSIGGGREEMVMLRGLPPEIVSRPGPIAARRLMGMPDAALLRD